MRFSSGSRFFSRTGSGAALSSPDCAEPDPLHPFDVGLQPERTRLSWGRTLLSLLVISGALLKIIAEWRTGVGLLLCLVYAVMALFLGLYMHRRYAAFTRTHDMYGPGPWLVAVASFASLLGICGLSWVLWFS